MATFHGSPTPGTCHTEFSVANKYTYLVTQAHHEPRGGWEGGKSKAKRQSYAKQNYEGKNCTGKARLRMPTAIIRWPTADPTVNSDSLI